MLTYEEILKYYIYVKLQIKQRKDPSFKAIATIVAQRLEILWKKAYNLFHNFYEKE